jgi:hypothetical protein
VSEEYEDYMLTFPDGKIVGEGELGLWLSLIEDDPDLKEEHKDVARGIVHYIRAHCN